ncbi:MAG: hypothetical protein C5B59_19955 [Bacteroidetes bacterium]|nr:MAG: hypothetical protein C5B59_19955 [Bacteroidota bacterium]
MAKDKLSRPVRTLLVIGAVALVIVIFVPMWRIDLVAPQYPEGLTLLIYTHKLGGNVDIVNGLNHYIGMRTLHTEDFVEFSILPYMIGFFALVFFIVAILGNRRLLNILLIVFIAFGIMTMFDFWRWEYNYGHNLNPEAPIIVPGMAYDPPLIGYKQLLNFSAYSIPSTGGWLFMFAGVLLVVSFIIAYRNARKIAANKVLLTAQALALAFGLESCSAAPQPILTGKDNCAYCTMMVTDLRFTSELVTQKGRIFKFDDSHCLISLELYPTPKFKLTVTTCCLEVWDDAMKWEPTGLLFRAC